MTGGPISQQRESNGSGEPTVLLASRQEFRTQPGPGEPTVLCGSVDLRLEFITMSRGTDGVMRELGLKMGVQTSERVLRRFEHKAIPQQSQRRAKIQVSRW